MKLRVTPPTIHRRVKRLEREGYIKEYVAHVDPRKLGKGLSSFVHVQIEYPKDKKRTHEEVIQDYID
jgi:Lrp/AsnC family leucine-responsive transcriptional regulator